MKLLKGVFLTATCLVYLLLSFPQNFSLAACDPDPSVKIEGDSYTSSSIQDAYNYATNDLALSNFTLRLAGEVFTEDLFLDGGAVVLDGGYDCSFTTKNSTTGIFGTVTIASGSLNFAAGAGSVEIVSTNQCEFDSDFDGYTSIGSCAGSADDCNDNDLAINPGAVEICDGLDNNCDGQIDEDATGIDADGDGYYAIGSCGEVADDCNDYVFSINPGAVELPYDGIDQDCNGSDLIFLEDYSSPVTERCSWCHGVDRSPDYNWSDVHNRLLAPDGTCAACHVATASNILPGHYGQMVRTAGNNMDAGSTIVCASCHDQVSEEHNFGANIVMAKVFAAWANNNLSCDSCHENRATLHATDLAHDNRVIDNMCSICHTSDTTLLGSPGNGTLANSADVDALHRSDCALCHNYTGTIVDVVTVRQEIQHGLGGSLITCTDCHTNNGNESNHHGTGISGVGCVECHGHDTGSFVDADTQAPYTAGTIVSQGRGTVQSHSTHTEITGADAKGPGIYCDTCHDIWDFPYFKSGTDIDGNGRFTLAETNVCDACHSGSGSYDGLEDASVGAKRIWSAGAYDSTESGSLQEGKEKWCATCHDEDASEIAGVTAPNIIGDEDGDYIYGSGWGYYKTGHGLSSAETFPSKGGVVTLSGRPVGCDSCHDFATAHIDGEPRTYDDGDSSSLDPSVYRQGYRLKLIDTQEPILVPRSFGSANNADTYRVCFQGGCHLPEPFTDAADMNTNLVTDGINRHEYHLRMFNTRFASDWSGENNSGITCVTCHNVHGSTQLAMVRDGKLSNHEPGLQIWYKSDGVSYIPFGTTPPEPQNLPLPASDGTAWIGASSTNLCSHCHGNGNVTTEDRLPFQDVAMAPLLTWSGGTGLVSDGVAPDSAASLSTFTFRVVYHDDNNDLPSPIEVWVDLNDDGSYGVDEKYTMAETEAEDQNLYNGKTYSQSLSIVRAGDGVLNYRFYATDGTDEATGTPTADHTLTVLNNAPSLSWTGETHYQDNGANPDIGGNGATFTFRINYTDADNDAASTLQVWIDENDDASYEVGEVYDLTEVDNGDTTTSDGKLYALSRAIAYAGDGDLTYRFYAADAEDEATGTPNQDSVLNVQSGDNSRPSIEFVSAGCTVKGVKPQSGADGADFTFTVSYADIDNESPATIQVWIDEDDNGTYEATEQYDLTEVDGGDTSYSNGKLYSTTRVLLLAGDNALSYRFYATDGIDTAFGEPARDHGVTVVDGLKVRPAGGSGWYSTIQSAIDAVDGAHTVLVYDGTYNEDILFEWGANDSNTTLRSACGPDTTIINGSSTGAVVTFSRYSGGEVDGFQVTGGTTGIAVEGTQVSINNCQVHDNHGPNGGGIFVVQSGDMPLLTLTNSEIYNNSSDRGGGVRIWRGTGHIISNTIIRNNSVTGDSIADGGGGIHLFQIGEIIISNTVIKENVSTNTYSGGGIYVSQVPDTIGAGLTVVDSTISDNTTGGGGGGVYSEQSKTHFVRSSITDNTAGGSGGAIAHPSAGITTSFENCILTNNQSSLGGMAKLNGGTLNIINSTIANNQSTGLGGAIYNQLATITIRNSILWGNKAANTGHIASFNGGSLTISDAIVQSGDDGNFINPPFFSGNVTPVVNGFTSEDDPWFTGDGDYHIQSYSSAVDNASATDAPDLDIDYDSRPQGAGYDIGADEYSP